MYSHRYIARIILEAETPLFVGSGESTLLTDAIVQKDAHGFPMIPGTSLTGVLRHALESDKTEDWNSFFGYQSKKGNKGLGAQIKISSASLLLENGLVAEGITPAFNTEKYEELFSDLPVRQHVRIDHKGTAEEHGLFDNEVVYKGCRFVFDVELKGSEKDNEKWEKFLNEINSPLFRIGQGTRNGYGKLKVLECKTKTFDLRLNEDFDAYLNYNISLNAKNNVLQPYRFKTNEKTITHYTLQLVPESFFIFGAGYGDEEVDAVPVKELVVEYDDKNTLKKPKEYTLIPATSIKGTLAHRTAYYYNKSKEYYADNYNDNKFTDYLYSNNEAVYQLFGVKSGDEQRDEGVRGKVILNDILIAESEGINNDKIFNHVAIDRFTGGAMDGALFSEKVTYFEDKETGINIDVYVENNIGDEYISAFEKSLIDICKGLLPLGGMTTKGHGIFTGKLLKNNEIVYDYEN